jgi:YVTN family beta-propeller protein
VYVYSLPDLKRLSGIHVGDHPDWLTITPDGKSVYVANAGSNSVSVLDAASRTEITRIRASTSRLRGESSERDGGAMEPRWLRPRR